MAPLGGVPGIVIAGPADIAALGLSGEAPAMARIAQESRPWAPGDPYVAVVDYHKGNLLSVERGLAAAGLQVRVTDEPAVIAQAAGAVIPGVGAFDDAMAYMRDSGQADALCDLARSGVPILGICLGMQLLFDRGSEHAQPPTPGEAIPWTPGLALMRGDVERLRGEGGVKVPHVGWNSVEFTSAARHCPLLEGVEDGMYFYFTHSYVCVPGDTECVVGTTEHGQRFASAVWDGANLFGVQFHPEKSSEAGAQLLRNFAAIVARSQGIDPAELAAAQVLLVSEQTTAVASALGSAAPAASPSWPSASELASVAPASAPDPSGGDPR